MDKISIDKTTRLRVNAFAMFTDEDGTRHVNYPKDRLEWIDPPAPPADYTDETYYRTEQDDAPYVIFTKKSDEVITELFINKVVSATQSRLDTFAQTRNYDGILSACTYATSSVPKFQAEGQCCVNSRDATWASLYTIFGEVQAGTRPMPESVDAVMELLPVLEWPVDET